MLTTLLKDGRELVLRQDNKLYIIYKNKCELADGVVETEQMIEIPKNIIKHIRDSDVRYMNKAAKENNSISQFMRLSGYGRNYHKIYIKNGIVHNDKAPAIKRMNGRKVEAYYYMRNGLAHNDVGYAYENISDGDYRYLAINGVQYDSIKDFYEAQKDTKYASKIFANFFAKKAKY